MKKILTIVLLVVANLTGYSQDNFKWEKVDSVNKTKDKLYSDTKLFIAKTWNSANNVTQTDDKENGIIIIKGINIQEISTWSGKTIEYIYSYVISIKIKDNKYKIQIDDVTNTSARCGYNSLPKNQPQTSSIPESKFPGVGYAGVKENEWNYVKSKLKSDLQNIVDSYSEFIKNSKDDSNW